MSLLRSCRAGRCWKMRDMTEASFNRTMWLPPCRLLSFPTNLINASDTRRGIAKAFSLWSDVSPFSFREVPADEEADIKIGENLRIDLFLWRSQCGDCSDELLFYGNCSLHPMRHLKSWFKCPFGDKSGVQNLPDRCERCCVTKTEGKPPSLLIHHSAVAACKEPLWPGVTCLSFCLGRILSHQPHRLPAVLLAPLFRWHHGRIGPCLLSTNRRDPLRWQRVLDSRKHALQLEERHLSLWMLNKCGGAATGRDDNHL